MAMRFGLLGFFDVDGPAGPRGRLGSCRSGEGKDEGGGNWRFADIVWTWLCLLSIKNTEVKCGPLFFSFGHSTVQRVFGWSRTNHMWRALVQYVWLAASIGLSAGAV
jgi:hypothetical protein